MKTESLLREITSVKQNGGLSYVEYFKVTHTVNNEEQSYKIRIAINTKCGGSVCKFDGVQWHSLHKVSSESRITSFNNEQYERIRNAKTHSEKQDAYYDAHFVSDCKRLLKLVEFILFY